MLKGVLVLYNEIMLVTTVYLPNVTDIYTSFPYLFPSTHGS
jgi:hypothetical protein